MRRKLFCALIIVGLSFLFGCGGDNDSFRVDALAGPDQNVTTGSLVTLDGSSSYSSEGDTLTYSWSFTSLPVGSSATLSDQSVVNPTFTADLDGVYVLDLVVNDGTIDSIADSVTITAASGNSAPVANAGGDQSITTGATVTLIGSGSSDADLDTLTYSWSITSAPATSTAALSDATIVNPTFDADLDGSYVLQLIVNDGTVDGTPDTVIITAAIGNAAPVADAGADQNVNTGATVTLDGSGSSDADLDTLAYTWNLTSAPTGSGAALSDTTIVNPTFDADLDGSYVLQLIVNDGTVDSTPDTVVITATALTTNAVPVANAGAAQNVSTTSTVTLDGSGSLDADQDPLSYLWSMVSGPDMANLPTLSDTTIVNPTFDADLDGSYVIRLIVNDGTVDSAPDTVTITAATASTTSGLLDSSFGSGGVAIYDVLRASHGHSITLDSAGNSYVAGSGPNTNPTITRSSMYVWKYDSAGVLDNSFSGDGIVTYDNPIGTNGAAKGYGIALDSAGNIYVTGESADLNVNNFSLNRYFMAIWKFLPSGARDYTFGTSGVVLVSGTVGGRTDRGYAIALDSTDNIYVVGASGYVAGASASSMVVWKYDNSGAPDTSFGTDGIVVHNDATGGGITLDNADNIYVTGSTGYMTIWKYDSDGTLDTSFGTAGIVVHNNANATGGMGKDITLDNAGNIYVSGYSTQIAIFNYDMVVWKYKSDGTLDDSFATVGFVTYDNGSHDQGDGIVLDSAANIYVTGYNRNTTDDMVILKYDSGGALDSSFGTGGVVVYDGGGTAPGGGDKGHGIALDSANGIYVAGESSYDMAIWKYK